MKPWLEMPANLASWQRLRVAISWVFLARNVQKLQDWLTIVSSSNAFAHTMTTQEIVSLVECMRWNCGTQHNGLVFSKHVSWAINRDSKSTQFVTFCEKLVNTNAGNSELGTAVSSLNCVSQSATTVNWSQIQHRNDATTPSANHHVMTQIATNEE